MTKIKVFGAGFTQYLSGRHRTLNEKFLLFVVVFAVQIWKVAEEKCLLTRL